MCGVVIKSLKICLKILPVPMMNEPRGNHSMASKLPGTDHRGLSLSTVDISSREAGPSL
jgi:hypothetical protein